LSARQRDLTPRAGAAGDIGYPRVVRVGASRCRS
jgi:hypothetical protein